MIRNPRRFIAQRRPGRIPRRHPQCTQSEFTGRSPLNEGRGAYPGDTSMSLGQCAVSVSGTLNEGRGAYPGDTGDLNGGSSA